mgnify:CR=1 FL=1
MKKYCLLLFLLLGTTYGEDLKTLVSLSTHNETIQIAKYNNQALQNKYTSMKRSKLPNVSVGANYANNLEESISAPANAVSATLSLNYSLYDGGQQKYSLLSLEEKMQSSKQNLQALENSIALQVITHYFNYQSLLASKKSIEQEIQKLKLNHKKARQFLKANLSTQDKLSSMEASLESGNLNLHEVDLSILTLLHQLSNLTGKQVTISSNSKLKDIQNITKDTRADIQALEYNAKDALWSANASKSASRPSIRLGNQVAYSSSYYLDNAFSNADNLNNQFTLSLQWTLFDFQASSYNYQSLYSQYLSSLTNYEYEKKKATTELDLAHQAYEIAKLKIGSAKARLKASNNAYASIEKKYQNNIVEQIVYLDALSSKYNAVSALENAKNDLEIKKAHIVYQSGQNLKDYL